MLLHGLARAFDITGGDGGGDRAMLHGRCSDAFAVGGAGTRRLWLMGRSNWRTTGKSGLPESSASGGIPGRHARR
jgi:hypothetical protein